MNNIDTVYPYCQLPLLHCLPLARANTNAITIVYFFHISLRFICFHIFPTHPLPFLQHFHYHSLIVLIFGILPLITFNFHTVFQLIFFARTASCANPTPSLTERQAEPMPHPVPVREQEPEHISPDQLIKLITQVLFQFSAKRFQHF